MSGSAPNASGLTGRTPGLVNPSADSVKLELNAGIFSRRFGSEMTAQFSSEIRPFSSVKGVRVFGATRPRLPCPEGNRPSTSCRPPNPVPGRDALASLALVEAAYATARAEQARRA